eukprot:TRINITY_DN11672_c0_g1_i1.p1 TRINITY_DN11672_c0_g1~~TRINITY_DN11672_c0_g1_i1.p1  ORF type:complete len:453 (+),score=124.29 TRINITY_DN11672_c0_g1_i1:43-1401(+)
MNNSDIPSENIENDMENDLIQLKYERLKEKHWYFNKDVPENNNGISDPYKLEWRLHKKHFILLTSSGSSLISSWGDSYELSPLFGVINSFVHINKPIEIVTSTKRIKFYLDENFLYVFVNDNLNDENDIDLLALRAYVMSNLSEPIYFNPPHGSILVDFFFNTSIIFKYIQNSLRCWDLFIKSSCLLKKDTTLLKNWLVKFNSTNIINMFIFDFNTVELDYILMKSSIYINPIDISICINFIVTHLDDDFYYQQFDLCLPFTFPSGKLFCHAAKVCDSKIICMLSLNVEHSGNIANTIFGELLPSVPTDKIQKFKRFNVLKEIEKFLDGIFFMDLMIINRKTSQVIQSDMPRINCKSIFKKIYQQMFNNLGFIPEEPTLKFDFNNIKPTFDKVNLTDKNGLSFGCCIEHFVFFFTLPLTFGELELETIAHDIFVVVNQRKDELFISFDPVWK